MLPIPKVFVQGPYVTTDRPTLATGCQSPLQNQSQVAGQQPAEQSPFSRLLIASAGSLSSCCIFLNMKFYWTIACDARDSSPTLFVTGPGGAALCAAVYATALVAVLAVVSDVLPAVTGMPAFSLVPTVLQNCAVSIIFQSSCRFCR